MWGIKCGLWKGELRICREKREKFSKKTKSKVAQEEKRSNRNVLGQEGHPRRL